MERGEEYTIMDLEDIYIESYLKTPTPPRTMEDRIKDLKTYISSIYKGVESLQVHFRNGKAAKASRVILSELLQMLSLLKTHILPSDRNFDEMSISEKLAQIQKLFGASHMAISQIKRMNGQESEVLQDIENKLSVITNFFAEYVYEINRHRK